MAKLIGTVPQWLYLEMQKDISTRKIKAFAQTRNQRAGWKCHVSTGKGSYQIPKFNPETYLCDY